MKREEVREAHLVVDNVIVKGAHSGLADRSAVTLLGRLPVATLQVAGSGHADLDSTIDHEDVIKH